MKKIIVFIFLFTTLSTVAQNYRTQYDTCQYLTQFEGEWLYANNQDTVRIYLRPKRNFSVSVNYFCDNLYGWHEYKRGNIIVESNYMNRFMYLPFFADSLKLNRPSITLINYTCNASNINKLEGYITDLNQANERHAVKAEKTGGGSLPTYLLFKQSYIEFQGAFTGAYGMTLPKEFLLTKQ